jgi:hypothetical protein
MASIKTIERNIGNREKFDVIFRHLDGKNVRADREEIPSYPFARMAKGNITVKAWKEGRFTPTFPGFKCDVLNGQGKTCHGGTLLSRVRDSYDD